MNQEGAVREALARSCLYRLISRLFLYPEEGTIPGLNWDEGEEALTFLGNRVGLEGAFESLRGSLENSADIQSEHVRVFSHTLGEDCPPYETQYGDGNEGQAQIFQQTQELGDIAGFYRAFGLEVSDQAKDRFDHISIELEFMAFLAYKEAYALVSDGGEKEKKEKVEKVEICRDAQKKFLSDHLGRWVPLFTRRLEVQAKEGFYQRLALVTERFLAFETEAYGLRPLEVKEVTPNPFEPDGSCYSCESKDLCVPKDMEESS
ncbi:MAG: molecular chaperone [Candidatus Methylomirabilales bacterium]